MRACRVTQPFRFVKKRVKDYTGTDRVLSTDCARAIDTKQGRIDTCKSEGCTNNQQLESQSFARTALRDILARHSPCTVFFSNADTLHFSRQPDLAHNFHRHGFWVTRGHGTAEGIYIVTAQGHGTAIG